MASPKPSDLDNDLNESIGDKVRKIRVAGSGYRFRMLFEAKNGYILMRR